MSERCNARPDRPSPPIISFNCVPLATIAPRFVVRDRFCRQ